MKKSFTVIYIPNHRLNEDDPSDFKEFKKVTANTSGDACSELSKCNLIVQCYENNI